jgi:S1-C subfamily serine protease
MPDMRELTHFSWAVLILALVVSGSARAAPPPRALEKLEGEVKAAVARVRPAVVNISAVRLRLETRAEGTMLYRSIGSGVIVDPRGYVLTNAHVVEGARTIRVRLWRSTPVDFTGRIVHQDHRQDLALLKIVGSGSFPSAALGGPGAARVGDWVVAIGSPFGLEHSVSMGIVSDRARRLQIDGRSYENLIQTDAAINQGNSGGPLINLSGEVIGISTAIYAPRGTFSGVGFAIPADRAGRYLQKVMPAARLAAGFEKEPIRPGSKAPHADMGSCTNCHTFIGTAAGPAVRQVAMAAPVSRSGAHRDWKVIQGSAAFILAAAVLFNMLGLGGGFFYVPILLLFGVGFHVASATSLFVITAAHLSALYVFVRSGLIDYKLALVLEPVTCLGAFLGALSSGLFGEAPLSLMFGGILILASYLMHRNYEQRTVLPLAVSSRWTWQRSFAAYEYVIDLPVGLPVAFTIGYLGGMLGFAGGVIKVPLMVLLFGVPIKVAIATSSLMVAVTSMVGCVGHGFAGHFDARLAFVLAVAAVAGAQIGSRLTIRADRFLLKRIFAVVLLVVAVWMIGRVL